MALLNLLGTGSYTVVENVLFSGQRKFLTMSIITYLNSNKTSILAQWHTELAVKTDGHEVITRTLSVPPETPAAGDEYLVAAGATGSWSGLDYKVVVFDGVSWVTRDNIERVYLEDEEILLILSGNEWLRDPGQISQAEFDVLFSTTKQNELGSNLLKLCYDYLKIRPEYSNVTDA